MIELHLANNSFFESFRQYIVWILAKLFVELLDLLTLIALGGILLIEDLFVYLLFRCMKLEAIHQLLEHI